MNRRDWWGHKHPKLFRGVCDGMFQANFQACSTPNALESQTVATTLLRSQGIWIRILIHKLKNTTFIVIWMTDSTSGANQLQGPLVTPPSLHIEPLTVTVAEGLRRWISSKMVPIVFRSGHSLMWCIVATCVHPIPLLTGAAQPGRGNAFNFAAVASAPAATVSCCSRGSTVGRLEI